MAKRRRGDLTVLHRASGWWVTLSYDKTRYVAGPWGTEREAKEWVATLAPSSP
jgi:hypothetical protein